MAYFCTKHGMFQGNSHGKVCKNVVYDSHAQAVSAIWRLLSGSYITNLTTFELLAGEIKTCQNVLN